MIEIALALEEINEASASEKSIRHGHPSILHQVVDPPSAIEPTHADLS